MQHLLDLVTVLLGTLLLSKNLAGHNVGKGAGGNGQNDVRVHAGHWAGLVDILDSDSGIVTVGTP